MSPPTCQHMPPPPGPSATLRHTSMVPPPVPAFAPGPGVGLLAVDPEERTTAEGAVRVLEGLAEKACASWASALRRCAPARGRAVGGPAFHSTTAADADGLLLPFMVAEYPVYLILSNSEAKRGKKIRFTHHFAGARELCKVLAVKTLVPEFLFDFRPLLLLSPDIAPVGHSCPARRSAPGPDSRTRHAGRRPPVRRRPPRRVCTAAPPRPDLTVLPPLHGCPSCPPWRRWEGHPPHCTPGGGATTPTLGINTEGRKLNLMPLSFTILFENDPSVDEPT